MLLVFTAVYNDSSQTDLWERPIVPDVPVVRETVVDVAWLLFLHVLLDRVEGLRRVDLGDSRWRGSENRHTEERGEGPCEKWTKSVASGGTTVLHMY